MQFLINWATEFIGKHRRWFIFNKIGLASYLVLRAYENRNFRMESNGEEWLLKTSSKLKNLGCVFDVGANVGEWLVLCRKYISDAPIHAFEIAPQIFSELKGNTTTLKNVVLNATGLSDQNAEIEIFFSENANFLTTAYKANLGKEFDLPGSSFSHSVTSQRVQVICGDDYVSKNGINHIDILKIDVEGMEGSVLRGFEKMFAQHRIRLVQFEYNNTNIVSKFLLRDAYEFFGKYGYKVGKLYTNYVDFRDYHYRHEDFCGPNMVAIFKDDIELIELLNSRGK